MKKFMGDKLHQAVFQLHRYLNVPLRLYINKPKSIFLFLFFGLFTCHTASFAD